MGLSREQQALITRWETFLSRLEQRHAELRTEADGGMQGMVDEVLAADEVDTRAVFNALEGLESRLNNLPDKADKAWEDEAEDLVGALNEDFDGKPDLHDMAHDRLDDCKMRMTEEWERFKARWGAHLFRTMWPKVDAGLREPADCTQCGSNLGQLDRRFPQRAQCGSCGAVNQVLVPTNVATYRSQAPHQFAQEASIELRFQIERARVAADRDRRARDWGPEPIASLDQWEAMERRYWETYAKVVTETGWQQPEKAGELVESRMEMFKRQSIMTDQRWRRARGL